jgi:branched-subunit amino acid aminotransferase/4-amino-4-deoxychorismate lyase
VLAGYRPVMTSVIKAVSFAPGTAGQPGLRIEVDGLNASAEQLRAVVLADYGHFTAMQVRNRRVRGLGRHLARLDAANREVFGSGLDAARVLDHIRHALGDDTRDASVRVYIRELQDRPSVMVTVRPPGGMLSTPWKLQSVPYQRSLAHVKHLGDFGRGYFQRLALRNGCDEALLTGPGGVISEGSVTNIGFCDGTGISWPAAPALQGITMQLLNLRIADYGLRPRRIPVRLSDVGSFAAVFVTNARGIAPVGQIDDMAVPVDPELMKTLLQAYDSAGWDPI